MSASITRGQLLSRSAKGGATLLVAGSALGRFVDTAAAAPLPTGDLAYARLLVGVELLASDFYSQAIAAANSTPAVAWYLKRASFNEQEHYQSVAGILSGAGQTPAVAGDIDFSYPAGTFDSQGSIAKLAQQLENLSLGRVPRRDRRHADRRAHRQVSRRSPRARPSTPPTSRRCSAARRSGAPSRPRSPSTRSRTRSTRSRPRKGQLKRATLRFSRFTSLLALVVLCGLLAASGALARSGRTRRRGSRSSRARR